MRMKHGILATTAAFTTAVSPAGAGELELGGGLQATTTGWRGDHGGGPALDASWWLRDALALTFSSKEHYVAVDERMLSYFGLGVSTRRDLGRTRATGALGIVHQHEEPVAALLDQPLQALLGVGDGIRHRAGLRGALHLALPVRSHRRGDLFVAVDLDAAWFGDDRGPRWMASAGASVGFTYRLGGGR